MKIKWQVSRQCLTPPQFTKFNNLFSRSLPLGQHNNRNSRCKAKKRQWSYRVLIQYFPFIPPFPHCIIRSPLSTSTNNPTCPMKHKHKTYWIDWLPRTFLTNPHGHASLGQPHMLQFSTSSVFTKPIFTSCPIYSLHPKVCKRKHGYAQRFPPPNGKTHMPKTHSSRDFSDMQHNKNRGELILFHLLALYCFSELQKSPSAPS